MPHDPIGQRRHPQSAPPPLADVDPTPLPNRDATQDLALAALLQDIAGKVDAGEPVQVEPSGYRALTQEQLSWRWAALAGATVAAMAVWRWRR